MVTPMPTYQKNYSVKLYNREVQALELLELLGMFNGKSHTMRECTKAFIQVAECLCMGKTDPKNFTIFNAIVANIARNKDSLNQKELFDDKREGVTFEHVEIMRKALLNKDEVLAEFRS